MEIQNAMSKEEILEEIRKNPPWKREQSERK